ncbi:restriction endonuclease subunit S [Acidovorax sp. JG5]|uniref:restriction endonuclease subunit S n=1 Tax=Acidovorax sp. JG5 TaxID=2822718 RepID=UPI001B32E9AC|nr:restriction endonuclease subunit S [Acidovorax sp. JG5]MBP3982294.1 restriction endonuclease subunit S [Acidovorax sp. JG5]
MLLSNLDLLATAPGGVARLRELILTLAVQGKLVPQDPADEPAGVLLQKIRAEKDRLIAEGKSKRDKPLAEIAEEEKPFELPQTWEWAPLGEVVEIVRGITFPANEKTKEEAPGRIACLRTANVQEQIEWDDLLFIAESFVGREDQKLQLHDIVMSMANSRELVGKVALVKQIPHSQATFGGFLGVLRPWQLEPRFVMALLRTPYARSTLIDSASQTTNIANVSLGKLRPLAFPVPPLAEQSRIVTRVEELMRLCDALQAKGQLQATQHAQLVSTLLGTLTASATPEELAENWQRVAQHFDLLLDRPEAIDALEQTLLQLAVRGLLVPQDPTDEPASILLARMCTEKDRLIAIGQIKRDKPLPPITDEEKPFELPVGWEWVRLGEIVLISSGVTLGRKTAIPSPVSLPYLRVANVQRWHLNLSSMKEVVIDQSELARFQLLNGDLLITEGGDWDKVGRTAIWRDELQTCLHQNHVFKARGISTVWNPIWAELYLNSAVARAYFASSAKQTTNLASINMTQLKDCAFPVPPLAEQSRIVARVTALRRLCADLRQRLAEREAVQARLAEALVHEVSLA